MILNNPLSILTHISEIELLVQSHYVVNVHIAQFSFLLFLYVYIHMYCQLNYFQHGLPVLDCRIYSSHICIFRSG